MRFIVALLKPNAEEIMYGYSDLIHRQITVIVLAGAVVLHPVVLQAISRGVWENL